MYSSEYTSGFSGPAASHLAAPPSPRHESNVGQAPSRMLKKFASFVLASLTGTVKPEA
jgi:hypothetical protein